MTKNAPRLMAPKNPNRAADDRLPQQKCQLCNNPAFPKILVAAQTAPDVLLNRSAFELKLPNVMGPDAPLIRRMMSVLAEQVYAIGGLNAFDCPKPSAAVHEAGHCVIYACEGLMPTRAAIWPIKRLGRTQWVGKTYGTPPWQVDDKTTVEADLRHARCLMAGVISESLFDPDYRLGSSLDELAVTSEIIRTAAVKTGRSPQHLWGTILAEIASQLKRHDQQVFEISAELTRKHTIQRRRLRSFLSPLVELKKADRSE
jgi:hypothetical protein